MSRWPSKRSAGVTWAVSHVLIEQYGEDLVEYLLDECGPSARACFVADGSSQLIGVIPLVTAAAQSTARSGTAGGLLAALASWLQWHLRCLSQPFLFPSSPSG